VSHGSLSRFHSRAISEYSSRDSWNKILTFGRAFLGYLAKTHFDIRYTHFNLFLEQPKSLKERKSVSSRIVTVNDVQRVIEVMMTNWKEGRLSHDRMIHHLAFTLFGAYTGQRVESTIGSILTSQFETSLKSKPPVLLVRSDQDKIRMEHYVPLHPNLLSLIRHLINIRPKNSPLFSFMSYQQWLKRSKIPLSRINSNFVAGDLRKFSEQHGDVIQWDQNNRAYILTHAVSGVDWAHYKNPLPEHVYRIYMKYWGDIHLVPIDTIGQVL
jgi:hypothetical protein